jgi:hypothetical protein
MSELNLAVTNAIISRHLKVDIESEKLEYILTALAVRLDQYEQKVLDLEHALDLKEKALSRQLGLT